MASASPGRVRCGRQLHRSGHQFPHRRRLGIAAGKGQLAQHVAFGKDAGHPAFTVDHAYGSDMAVQHQADGVRRAGLDPNGCHIRITQFQNAHMHPLGLGLRITGWT